MLKFKSKIIVFDSEERYLDDLLREASLYLSKDADVLSVRWDRYSEIEDVTRERDTFILVRGFILNSINSLTDLSVDMDMLMGNYFIIHYTSKLYPYRDLLRSIYSSVRFFLIDRKDDSKDLRVILNLIRNAG